VRIKAPAERNFRRARARPAKRRSIRALFSWRVIGAAALVLVAALAAARAAQLVYASALFRVSRVAVHGNVRISTGEVQAMVREIRGTNILTADLGYWRAKLLESPWVSDVSLRRVLPATVDVYVSERQAFGLGRAGDRLYLVAADGTVLDEFGPRYAAFDLPIVDGLFVRPAPARPGRTSRAASDAAVRVDPARAALAARVIEAVKGSKVLESRLSQIDVSNARDAVVLLDDDPALLHVGDERFRERLQSYLDYAETLRERVPNIDYVDLRFEERVYVKPRGRADRTAVPLPSAGRAF
jgi:cell division septal protein FtsQ